MADVLVVGAGPVGLTMAAELARHGVRPRIVDRLPAPSGYCKAIGVTPRTLEIWDTMGVVQPMIERYCGCAGFARSCPGQGARDAISDLSDLPLMVNLGIRLYVTERILTDHLARFGVTVERGVTLTELHDDGRRVRAMLAHPDGRVEQTEYRYVVGCDGAHSAVRHAVNIGFPGDRFPMEFILGDVAIDWDVPWSLCSPSCPAKIRRDSLPASFRFRTATATASRLLQWTTWGRAPARTTASWRTGRGPRSNNCSPL